MYRLFFYLVLTLLFCLLPMTAQGQKTNVPFVAPPASAVSKYIAQLTLTPKTKPAVRARMQQEIERLTSLCAGEVVAVRDSVIACVIVPSVRLFAGGDTAVSDAGKILLKKLLPPVATDCRIVVAVHTDDTGTPDYLQQLSDRRAESAAAFFAAAGMEVAALGRGAGEPLARNDTYRGRETNRRTEIYFIPADAKARRAARRR